MANLISKGAQLLLMAAQRAVGAITGPGISLSDTVIAQAIVDGKQIAKDKIMYVRRAIAGGGRQQILNESLAKTLGITNFENGALPKGRAMVITHIRLASNVNANPVAAEFDPVITDPSIVNGELYIQTQDGKELYQGPIGQLIPPVAPTNPADAWYPLENPILVQAGANLQIDAYLTGTGPAADTNLEVSLKGVENVQR